MNITSEVDRVLELQEWIQTGRAREIRVELGISQRMAAREIGVHESALLHWEDGTRRPHNRNAVQYHKFLERLIKHSRRSA